MNTGQFEQMSDCWSSEQQPATYYRTTAARARKLQADATTPRVKQYLDTMIAYCERLAGNRAGSLVLPIAYHREIRRVYEWAEIVEIDDAESLIIVTRVSCALSHAPVSRFILS
jgi:hypothetical protein